jgi:ribosomal protein S18 acetylase RimI-like enzyme
MGIRHAEPSDYDPVISNLNDWFGGRSMSDMLPKLFFVHFRETSFVTEKDNQIIGFLTGFWSQTFANEAYIHFVGVHPDYRKQGVGRALYERFYETVKQHGCKVVRCLTGPTNKRSIVFHTRMGFQIEPQGTTIDGVAVFRNYDGPDNDRVLFVKRLPT